jgi:hypothetical protein
MPYAGNPTLPVLPDESVSGPSSVGSGEAVASGDAVGDGAWVGWGVGDAVGDGDGVGLGAGSSVVVGVATAPSSLGDGATGEAGVDPQAPATSATASTMAHGRRRERLAIADSR